MERLLRTYIGVIFQMTELIAKYNLTYVEEEKYKLIDLYNKNNKLFNVAK